MQKYGAKTIGNEWLVSVGDRGSEFNSFRDFVLVEGLILLHFNGVRTHFLISRGAGVLAAQDVGFMAYNVLAGGMLTGKYLEAPAAPDESNPMQSLARTAAPRGRMDDISWGATATGVLLRSQTAAQENLNKYMSIL